MEYFLNMKKSASIIVLILIGVTACTTKPEVFSTNEGAIRGYDPVMYFTSGNPEKGSEQFVFHFNGADWHFTSAENLEMFKPNPEKYMPQFGGYCAYAVSQNYTYETDPYAFTIVEGKLYLNYDKETSVAWNEKRDEYIVSANENWPEVLKK